MDKDEREKFEEDIRKIFEEEGLNIETSDKFKKSVDFLDVRMHLENGEHEPYRKNGPPPKYVHHLSNHPPQVIRNLPSMIEKRVSSLCSSKKMFDKHAPFYNQCLQESGYTYQIKFLAQTEKENQEGDQDTWNIGTIHHTTQ